jgi:hypothetical protein
MSYAKPPMSYATTTMSYATPPMSYANIPNELRHTPNWLCHNPMSYATPPMSYTTLQISYVTPPMSYATFFLFVLKSSDAAVNCFNFSYPKFKEILIKSATMEFLIPRSLPGYMGQHKRKRRL